MRNAAVDLFAGRPSSAQGDVQCPEASPPRRPVADRRLAEVVQFEPLQDSWQSSAAWDEQRKRTLMLAMLPRERYRLAFEPGCSGGGIAVELAERCELLIVAHASPSALLGAQRRLAGRSGIRFERWDVPQQWPTEPLDLIVLDEIGYHLSPDRLEGLWIRARQSLAPGGHLLLSHARRPFDDSWLDGDEVHERAQQALSLMPAGRFCDDRFRIDVWEAAEATEPDSPR